MPAENFAPDCARKHNVARKDQAVVRSVNLRINRNGVWKENRNVPAGRPEAGREAAGDESG